MLDFFFLSCRFTKGSCENRSVTRIFSLWELCISLHYPVDANQLHDEELNMILMGHIHTDSLIGRSEC